MSLGVGSARAALAASVVAREGEGGVEDAARAAAPAAVAAFRAADETEKASVSEGEV